MNIGEKHRQNKIESFFFFVPDVQSRRYQPERVDKAKLSFRTYF